MKKHEVIPTQVVPVPSSAPAIHSIKTEKAESKWAEQREEHVIPGDVQYSLAHKQQRERVNRIRQCVCAAITIQRAWRRYKQ